MTKMRNELDPELISCPIPCRNKEPEHVIQSVRKRIKKIRHKRPK